MLDKSKQLTLVDPAVQVAKKQWERAKKYRPGSPQYSWTFERWFAAFEEELLFSDIAKTLSIGRERVRQIYNQWFKDFFGEKDGRARQRVHTTKQRRIRAMRLLPNDSILKAVAEEARAAGCAVDFNLHENGFFRLTSALINGHLCQVHQGQIPSKLQNSKRSFFKMSVGLVNLLKSDATIFVTGAEGYCKRIFVVPSIVLRGAYFTAGSRSRKYAPVYIPSQLLLTRRRGNAYVDWRKYENAWHLLAPKTIPSAP